MQSVGSKVNYKLYTCLDTRPEGSKQSHVVILASMANTVDSSHTVLDPFLQALRQEFT